MTTTTTAAMDFASDLDNTSDPKAQIAAFDAWTGTDMAGRAAARLAEKGFPVEWVEADKYWKSRRDEKVGCFTDRGIFRHTEYTAQIDLQAFAGDVEVIVRVRVSRLGLSGKPRAEVLVGAYVGGGHLDAFGKVVEPRFLCDSRNDPKVRAARNALGLD